VITKKAAATVLYEGNSSILFTTTTLYIYIHAFRARCLSDIPRIAVGPAACRISSISLSGQLLVGYPPYRCRARCLSDIPRIAIGLASCWIFSVSLSGPLLVGYPPYRYRARRLSDILRITVGLTACRIQTSPCCSGVSGARRATCVSPARNRGWGNIA